jgi:uncharacterized protein YabN with tetrapyrrole methylase and pyrophosphatase domain
MDKLKMALEEATNLLKQLTPSTLTADQLDVTKNAIAGLNIEEIIQNYLRGRNEASEEQAIKTANEINKMADGFNDELQRIKKIKNTLNLEALEPVISAASHFIRPVFRLTAALQDQPGADE